MLTSRRDLLGDPALDLRLARRHLALAGLQDLAHDHVLYLLGLDLGPLEAAAIAWPPRSVASSLERPPPSLPNGVRAVPRITVLGIDRTIASLRWTPGATTDSPLDAGADTIVVGIFDGEGRSPPRGGRCARRARRVRRSDPSFVALTHGPPRGGADPRRLRLARRVRRRARAVTPPRSRWAAHASSAPGCCAGSCRTRCPTRGRRAGGGDAARRLSLYGVQVRSGEDRAPAALVVSAHHDVGAAVERGRVVGEAANRARDLGNAPPNVMRPRRSPSGRARAPASTRTCWVAPESRPRGWARSRRSRRARTPSPS